VVRRLSSNQSTPGPAPDAPPSWTPVFVVTYGRSGSTLVQGLLNALPRTLVRGENGLFFVDLFRASDRATTFARKHGTHAPRLTTSAFYGAHRIREDRFTYFSRRLIQRTLLGPHKSEEYDRVGFKEVAWHELEAGETEAFFDWWDQVFPDAVYVLHTREREALPHSGFWRYQPVDEIYAKVDRVVEIQEHLRRTRPEQVVETRFEALTTDDDAAASETLRDLAIRLTGGCDDELLATLMAVRAQRHGPRGHDEGDEARDVEAELAQVEEPQTDG